MDFKKYDKQLRHKERKLKIAKIHGYNYISEAYYKLFLKEYTTTEIGVIFGVTKSNIAYCLNKMGVKLKPVGGRVNKEAKVFKECDDNLKKSSDILKQFAKTQGYKTFSEYVFKSLKTKTAVKLQQEIKTGGVKPVPSISRLWSVKNNVENRLNDQKEVVAEKKCKRCGNPVPPENHVYCNLCKTDNFRKAVKYRTDYNSVSF